MAEQFDDERMDASLNERVDRFNSSLDDFQKVVESGELTPDLIDSMDLTPQAKDRLVNTMSRFTPQQELQEELQPQVSAQPSQPLMGGSLFDSEFEPDFSIVEAASLQPVKTYSDKDAGELGEAVELYLEAKGEVADGAFETVKDELRTLSYSPLLNDVMNETQTEPPVMGSTEFFQWAKANPSEGRQLLTQAITERNIVSPEARLISSIIADMTPEAQKVFSDFNFITQNTLRMKMLDETISQAMGDQASKLSLWKTIVTAINPAQAAASRVDGGRLMNEMVEALGGMQEISKSEYTFKADAATKLSSYLLDKNISAEEAASRIEAALEFMRESETLDGSQALSLSDTNALWNLEYLELMQSELRQAGSGVGFGMFLDALDATDAVGWGDILYRLPRVMLLKILPKQPSALNPENLKQLARLVEEATTGLNTPRADSPLIFREGQASMFDQLGQRNPDAVGDAVRKALGSPNPEEAIHRVGLDLEDVAVRLSGDGSGIPTTHVDNITGSLTNTPVSPQMARLLDEVADLKTTDLLLRSELQGVGDKYAEIVASESRGLLYPSATTHSEILPDGRMDIGVLFGKNKKGGYRKLEEAQEAANFLFEGKSQILVRHGSKGDLVPLDELPPNFPHNGRGVHYFLKSEVQFVPDRRFTGQFLEDIFAPGNVVVESLLPHGARLERELFDLYSNRMDRANRITAMLGKELGPIKALGNADKEQWIRALLHGDEQGIEFTSRQQASDALGFKMTNKAWKAYEGTRNFYNIMGELRQQSVHRALSQGGYRGIYTRTGILEDIDGRVYGSPYAKPPERVPAPSSFESIPEAGVWGNRFLDTDTGTMVDLSQDGIKELYNQGKMIVRFNRPFESDAGTTLFGVVSRSQVKELPPKPMNIRAGHVDRIYDGHNELSDVFRKTKKGSGNQHVVNQVKRREIGGVDLEYTGVVGIYRTNAQATKARESMIARHMADNPNDNLADVEKMFAVDQSRERKMVLGQDSAGTVSNMPAHGRHRGQQIEGNGSSGLAELADVETTLQRGFNEARGIIGKDAIDVMKSRFANTFANDFDNYDGFPLRFDMLKSKPNREAKIEQAKRYYNAIKSMERQSGGRKFQSLFDHIEGWAIVKMESNPVIARAALALAKGAGITLDKLLQITTANFIAFRANYQIIANSAQSLLLVANNPVRFTTQTLPRSIATMLAMISPNKFSHEVLAKVFGGLSGEFKMTGPQLKAHINNMMRSGVFNINIAHDIASVMHAGGVAEAGLNNFRTAKFWGRANPINLYLEAAKVASVPAKAAITFNNFLSWNHALSIVAGRKGMDYAVSRRGASEVQGLMNRLTFSQNRSDQFLYQQQREAQFMFQFMQHPQKMFMYGIADPVVRAATGGKAGLIKKGSNPYADTWAQAMRTTFSMAALAGMGGVGSSMSVGLWDEAKDDMHAWAKELGIDTELTSVFIDGILSKLTEDVFGGPTDIGQRILATDMVQTTLRMMFTDEGALVMGGPAMNLSKWGKELYRLGRAYYTSDDMTFKEFQEWSLSTVIPALAGTSDAMKALWAYRMGSYITKDGDVVLDVEDGAWMAIGMSFTPDEVNRYYRNADLVRQGRDAMRSTVAQANRISQQSILRTGKKKEDLTPDDVISALLSGVRFVEVIYQSEPSLLAQAKEQLFNGYIIDEEGLAIQYADQMVRYLPSAEAIKALESQKKVYPKAVDTIDMMIQTIKSEQESL